MRLLLHIRNHDIMLYLYSMVWCGIRIIYSSVYICISGNNMCSLNHEIIVFWGLYKYYTSWLG